MAREVPTAGRARQVQRTSGKVWTERGRPPERYFTKRTAQARLRDVLDQAERGKMPLSTAIAWIAQRRYVRDPSRVWIASFESVRGTREMTSCARRCISGSACRAWAAKAVSPMGDRMIRAQ